MGGIVIFIYLLYTILYIQYKLYWQLVGIIVYILFKVHIKWYSSELSVSNWFHNLLDKTLLPCVSCRLSYWLVLIAVLFPDVFKTHLNISLGCEYVWLININQTTSIDVRVMQSYLHILFKVVRINHYSMKIAKHLSTYQLPRIILACILKHSNIPI